MKSNTWILLFLSIIIWSCSDSKKTIDPDPILVENVRELAIRNQTMAWSIFNEINQLEEDENVIISPWSLQVALTMAVAGAEGETKEEILELLGCSGCDETSLHEKMRDMALLLGSQNGHASLTSANALFNDPNRIEVFEDYADLIEAYYNAKKVDYNFSDPSTKDKINEWVKDKTNEKIEGILDEINDDDVAFLINALHFKADWSNAFAEEYTREGQFTKHNGETIIAQFMDLDANFNAVINDDFKAVDLPFKDSIFSMTVIAPRSSENPSLTDWKYSFNPAKLKAIYEDMNYGRILLQLPKMDVEFKDDLVPVLKALGMEKAFSDFEADFSRLGKPLIGPLLFISKVLHKAVLKVDERGAEGAAVTSIGISVTSVPPTYRFDHPYISVIRHIPTGAILFIAYVNDPGVTE